MIGCKGFQNEGFFFATNWAQVNNNKLCYQACLIWIWYPSNGKSKGKCTYWRIYHPSWCWDYNPVFSEVNWNWIKLVFNDTFCQSQKDIQGLNKLEDQGHSSFIGRFFILGLKKTDIQCRKTFQLTPSVTFSKGLNIALSLLPERNALLIWQQVQSLKLSCIAVRAPKYMVGRFLLTMGQCSWLAWNCYRGISLLGKT